MAVTLRSPAEVGVNQRSREMSAEKMDSKAGVALANTTECRESSRRSMTDPTTVPFSLSLAGVFPSFLLLGSAPKETTAFRMSTSVKQ